MTESGGITGMSLNDVRKLIEDKSLPEGILEVFDKLSGLVIALSPLYGGTGSAILWPLLEPKDALVGAVKAAIKRITRSRPRDYLEQAKRFAAANTLLTFTAYFDALRMCEPELTAALGLSPEDKRRIASQAAAHAQGTLPLDLDDGSSATALIFNVPHPATPHNSANGESRQRLYWDMGWHILSGADVELCMGTRSFQPHKVEEVLTERVPMMAESVYLAEFLGMVVDYQPFFVWSTLQDQADKDVLLRRLNDNLRAAGEDSQLRFELLGAALHELDLGLERLSRAIAAQPQSSLEGPRLPLSAAARAAEALRRRYTADIEQPVIDDRYDPPTGGPRLKYPGNAAAYVPQLYRQVRYAAGETHLERDEEWAELPAADDLGPAITRYVESPYGAESPLLILGHPGSGKSLLSRVYAARLHYPRYTVVRVELRDANPAVNIQKQIEDQIRKDTGYDVNWADLADNLPLSPPVVILDGYDELLQATGRLFTDYLDQVQRFQRDALIQNHPVRVIITSRITLIDKAIIPPGTTVLRLEPFDEPRRTEWISRWNVCNATYFQQAKVKPFKLRDNEKLIDLAQQPLLLLMLAIFDSADNALSERPDIDQTILYDELLRRFIERELGKGEHGVAFLGLHPEDRRPLVDRELIRLGVAAIGMFNRQEVKILRAQLDSDLAYFCAERPVTTDLYGQSQSEILLGSFFFIHESRSRLAADEDANGAQYAAPATKAAHTTSPTAFEFLHNTFGEFLAADFILRHVIENAATIRDLSGKPTLERARQQHLSNLSPYFFASLLYTPLHTRPNILTLVREWSFHRIPIDPSARAEILDSLDDIIRTQLRTFLVGTDSLDMSARARVVPHGETAPTSPPYDPLPTLGHLSVYTLNLIVLRTYLSDQDYRFDEKALDAGARPWDRLTALWRSWFAPESLGALSTQFTATRSKHHLTLEPARSKLNVTPNMHLETAYNTAVALADDLIAAGLGLQLASLTVFPENSFNALLDRFPPEAGEMGVSAQAMRARMYRSGDQEDFKLVYDQLGDHGFKVPEFMLNFVELFDRTMIAPRRDQLSIGMTDMRDLVQLSRYEAELLVAWCAKSEPLWLAESLLGSPERFEPVESPKILNSFLLSAAAAPVLRAANRRLNATQYAGFSQAILDGSSGRGIAFFDIDTAAALALLAWQGSSTKLCLQSLDVIQLKCERGAWHLCDIPLETWAGLADLFTENRADFEIRRRKFIIIMDDQMERFLPESQSAVSVYELRIIELWLQMLRIGTAKHRKLLLEALLNVIPTAVEDHDPLSRSWFLLLFRWARENDQAKLVNDILSGENNFSNRKWWLYFGAASADGPEAIDLDWASRDLTYREAMDLRWALNVWHESGAQWHGDPVGCHGPRFRRARPRVRHEAPAAK